MDTMEPDSFLNSLQTEQLQSVLSLTGMDDVEVCRAILENCDWDTQAAVIMYFDVMHSEGTSYHGDRGEQGEGRHGGEEGEGFEGGGAEKRAGALCPALPAFSSDQAGSHHPWHPSKGSRVADKPARTTPLQRRRVRKLDSFIAKVAS